MRKVLLGMAATIAFAVNPAFIGCGEAKISYSFGAKEMSASIAGTWQLSANGETHTFTLAQKSADVQGRADSGFFNEAAACSQRTLVASASACADTTDMPLVVTFIDGAKRAATATLVVHGATFTVGFLYLVIDGIDTIVRIKPDGTFERAPEGVQLVHTSP